MHSPHHKPLVDSTPGHINLSLAVLTFRRPDSLERTLASLADIAPPTPLPPHWQVCEVLVIDNDAIPSAQAAANDIAARRPDFPIRYIHEPQPGLSAARNRALDACAGDVLAFIDDDEVAGPGWPDGLIATMNKTGATLVGGPVRTIFDQTPPDWIAKGRFFDRPEPADHSTVTWLRSGNLAIDIDAIRSNGIRFDARFGATGGEDVHFSRTVDHKGLGLAWSATAIVSEHVGVDRLSYRWLARRERESTANWVRVELEHGPHWHQRALIAGRAAIRAGQGLGIFALGAAAARRQTMANGALKVERAVGSVKGLLGHHRPQYGSR